LFVGAAMLSTAATQARAAEGEAAPDADLQAAKFAFEEAQVLYTKDQFEESAAKFMSAFDKKPFSSFLFNAAVAYEKAKKLDKAIEAYQHYLTIDPQARDAVDVKGRIDSLKAVLAPPVAAGAPVVETQVLPAIATKGLVLIESKPAGANIYVDDTTKGVFATTPWQGSLAPKPVRLIFEAKGFKRETREIIPRSDKIIELYIAMSEEHFLGWIEVVSNVPGADVFIDRQDIGAIGRTPYTGHLKPGKHTLWVQKTGYEIGSREVDVQPGTATTHTINLDVVGYGTLKAGGKASEGGKLFVDGAQLCVLPCEKQLKPGDHAVQVQKEGMENYNGKLTVNRADITQMDLTYSPKPSRATAWTEAVFSAGFFAGGVFLGIKGNHIKDDIKSDVSNTSRMQSTSDSRTTTGKYYYIGADVCLGLGVVTAALATWNFLESGPPSSAAVKTFNPTNPAASKVSLLPMGVPSGAGMAATGRF
jgi:PEGA domain